mmetsp:Transcript_18832/g.47263  ORF Transcript_18832/g.47263 Transcript_18832/m.47263 type:complete len:232 (-) Transcript_18832:684-1379(-)
MPVRWLCTLPQSSSCKQRRRCLGLAAAPLHRPCHRRQLAARPYEERQRRGGGDNICAAATGSHARAGARENYHAGAGCTSRDHDNAGPDASTDEEHYHAGASCTDRDHDNAGPDTSTDEDHSSTVTPCTGATTAASPGARAGTSACGPQVHVWRQAGAGSGGSGLCDGQILERHGGVGTSELRLVLQVWPRWMDRARVCGEGSGLPQQGDQRGRHSQLYPALHRDGEPVLS